MDETKLLTYAELGAALGITPASAKRLAIRRGWQKTPGNDGKARVAVPIKRLEAGRDDTGDTAGDDPSDASGDDTADSPGDVTGDTAAAFLTTTAILTRHVERLEAELSQSKAHLEAEQRRSLELREERDLERQRAAQMDALKAVLEVEQRRAAELKEERDRWQGLATAPRGGLWGWFRRNG